jgi:phospholipid/cholesterol/gamma-HCH transport system ATP-binding protein
MKETNTTYSWETGESILEVSGLNSLIDGKQILTDINMEARAGEITAILGSSGSGKTTLLKHLLGIYPSSGPEVRVLGRNPSELDEADEVKFYQDIGVLYQEGALLNSLTVGENIGLPLEQHSQLPPDLIERIVRLKLQQVNLGGVYDFLPSELSAGMLKRAALARSIVMDPVILFCDEPGAGLDPVTLSNLDHLIVNLKDLLGMTVIMVTHEVNSIRRMADRVVFLENGHSVFTGTLAEALESPLPSLKEFFARATSSL